VFCDEWTVDLKTLLLESKVWDRLSPEERASFVVEDKPLRLIMSGAIDLATEAIVGLQFAITAKADLNVRTIESMLLDKGDWAEAGEGVCGWPMQGIPESLIIDRGSSYDNDQVYQVMAVLGIDHLGCVAGMPHLKGMIERLFRAAHERVLARFVGRTHSHPHVRPDYDSDTKARLTPELMIKAFLRFIVDIHHTTPRKELGGRSPLQAWHDQMRDGFGVTPPPDARVMRQVFGTPLTRKLTPSGLRVNNVHYHSEDLARLFMRDQKREYEIRWWPHDIGAIEVHRGRDVAAGGVCARRPRRGCLRNRARLAHGARHPRGRGTHPEPGPSRHRQPRPHHRDRQPALRGHLTPERIDAFETNLLRHLVTSESLNRRGPAKPLLGDVIEPMQPPGNKAVGEASRSVIDLDVME